MAAALVVQYPDRVRRVREYVAALSSDGRQRIQHWPGFVRRAVEEDFRWAEAERPEVASRSARPLTALVCSDAGCGYDMLSTRPVADLLAEPTACPYCDRPMRLPSDETPVTHSATDAAGVPGVRYFVGADLRPRSLPLPTGNLSHLAVASRAGSCRDRHPLRQFAQLSGLFHMEDALDYL